MAETLGDPLLFLTGLIDPHSCIFLTCPLFSSPRSSLPCHSAHHRKNREAQVCSKLGGEGFHSSGDRDRAQYGQARTNEKAQKDLIHVIGRTILEQQTRGEISRHSSPPASLLYHHRRLALNPSPPPLFLSLGSDMLVSIAIYHM